MYAAAVILHHLWTGGSSRAQLPECVELLAGRGIGDREHVGDPQRPAGALADLLDLDPLVDLCQGKLLGLGVGLEHAEVGDPRRRAAAAQAEALARARPVA